MYASHMSEIKRKRDKILSACKPKRGDYKEGARLCACNADMSY